MGRILHIYIIRGTWLFGPVSNLFAKTMSTTRALETISNPKSKTLKPFFILDLFIFCALFLFIAANRYVCNWINTHLLKYKYNVCCTHTNSRNKMLMFDMMYWCSVQNVTPRLDQLLD